MRFHFSSLIAGLLILSELYFDGYAPSENSTSTTAPKTWVIFPILLIVLKPPNLKPFRVSGFSLLVSLKHETRNLKLLF